MKGKKLYKSNLKSQESIDRIALSNWTSLLQLFNLEKGQCQVYVWKYAVLVLRSVVCKYERNPSWNEKVVSNVKVFYNFYRFT